MAKLYRRRFIPNEIISLTNDEILYSDEEILITKWEYLKERDDFKFGYSCYFLNDGFKISKFYTKEKQLLYTYCDIVEIKHGESVDGYIFNDLLVDVIIYNDGFVKVLDLDELATALDMGLINSETAKDALIKTNNLLSVIYSNGLNKLLIRLNEQIEKNPL